MGTINMNAMSAYRQAALYSEDTVITTSGEKGHETVREDGTFHRANIFRRLVRDTGEKTRNLCTRERLLENLADAIGYRVGTDERHNKVFSADFMKTLKSILGDDVLKSADFELVDGKVTSGRPLTQRRIMAIVSKLESYSKATAPFEAVDKTKVEADMDEAFNQKVADEYVQIGTQQDVGKGGAKPQVAMHKDVFAYQNLKTVDEKWDFLEERFDKFLNAVADKAHVDPDPEVRKKFCEDIRQNTPNLKFRRSRAPSHTSMFGFLGAAEMVLAQMLQRQGKDVDAALAYRLSRMGSNSDLNVPTGPGEASFYELITNLGD